MGPKSPSRKNPESSGQFDHEPSEFVEEFRKRNVSAVVRLNDAHTYDSGAFTSQGIAHHDVFFEDCTVPSVDVIEKFLNICDAATGLVAVHCLAGVYQNVCIYICMCVCLRRRHGPCGRSLFGRCVMKTYVCMHVCMHVYM